MDSSLETLTAAFERATAEKLRFQEEVNRTNKTIELANRLVKGLEVSTAGARWFIDIGIYLMEFIHIGCAFFRVRTCAGPIPWLSTVNRKKL